MPTRLLCLVALLAPSFAAAETVAFAHRTAAVGDAVEQTVRFEMRLEMTSRQGAEILDEDASEAVRTQRRRVTATDTREGKVVGADVRFFEAASTHNGETTTDPVAGKSYHCERRGESLTVTTDDGITPSMGEYALVVRAMETLGTTSPLAEFLAGKRVEVGEKLDLPADLAQRALGFDKQLGTVDRFELTLKSVESVDGRDVARFAATIEAAGAGAEQMGLVVGGVFDIETKTCRVVAVDLNGPIAMSGQRGVGLAAHQLDGRGQMRMQLAARYRDATR